MPTTAETMKRPTSLDLFLLLVIFNIDDALNTTYLVHLTDYQSELNPLIQGLMNHFDSSLILWLWKAIILAFVLLTLRLAENTNRKAFMRKVMFAGTGIFAIIAAYGTYLVYGTI